MSLSFHTNQPTNQPTANVLKHTKGEEPREEECVREEDRPLKSFPISISYFNMGIALSAIIVSISQTIKAFPHGAEAAISRSE